MSTYTYTFLAKDLMSNKLNQIKKSGQSTFGEIAQKHEKFRGDLSNTATQANKTKSSLSSLNGTIRNLGIGFGILEAFRLGSKMISWASDMEQTNIAFETMLGSASKAKAVVTDLKKFSDVTPFSKDEVIKSGRSLIAFGITANKLIPSLTNIGNVAAGLKIPFNEMSDLYGKMKVQNTIYAEDLNQLGGRGIPIFTELAKVMNVPSTAIKKLASEGKISFAQVEQAFANMSGEGGQFAGLMAKLAESAGGKWSTFSSKLMETGEKIGNKLLPYLVPMLDWSIKLLAYIPLIPPFFREIYTTLQDNAVAFGILGFAVAALSAKLIWAQTVTTYFTIAQKAQVLWTNITTGAQWLLNAAMSANPIGAVVAAIAALIAGFMLAYKNIGWFRGAVDAAWTAIKGFGGAIKEYVVDRFKEMLKGITGMGTALMHFFNGDWQKAWDAGKSATADLMGANSAGKFIGKMKGVGKDAAISYAKGYLEVKKKTGTEGAGASPDETKDGILGDNSPVATPPKGLDQGINNITGGGSKQTNITVTFDKLVETFTIQATTIKGGMENSEDELKKMMLRVLNSINQMQTSPA